MAISYKKLWKLLIDRDMKKKDLMALAGVSQSSITKMGHNDNVNTEVLVRICLALNCDLGDIAEIVLRQTNECSILCGGFKRIEPFNMIYNSRSGVNFTFDGIIILLIDYYHRRNFRISVFFRRAADNGYH